MAKGGVFETQGMVTVEGKAFVTTFVNEQPFGQMSPAEAIAMGTRCIQSAIEAERDAGLIKFLKSLGTGEQEVNALIVGMRDYRNQAGPSEGLGN
jgi:20S proteasome alpha/beta subunit